MGRRALPLVVLAAFVGEAACFSLTHYPLPIRACGVGASSRAACGAAAQWDMGLARRGVRLAARGLRMQVKPGKEGGGAEGVVGISKQGVFLAASSLTYAAIIGAAPEGSVEVLLGGLGEAFVRNLPAAIFCFGGADIATQQIERSMGLAATKSLDVRRVLSAVAVGVVCNAFGLAVWLHFLDGVVPFETIGVDSADGLAHLAAKSALHSWVWGTLGNTIALVGRRVLAGDTWEDAVQLWSDKIFPVTEKQLWFWPAWQAMNFALVSDLWQAQFTGMGSFFFNVFMSWVASSSEREVLERARLAEAVARAAPQEAEVQEEKERVLGGGRK